MLLNDSRGCSRCVEYGQELYEYFSTCRGVRAKRMVQYDYRDFDGELFSTVAPTLEKAQQKKETWINSKKS